MDNDPKIKGLYSPEKRQVACVLIGAAFGIDPRIARMFDVQDWFLAPEPDMMMVEAPLSQWEAIAKMPKDERPGPEQMGRVS